MSLERQLSDEAKEQAALRRKLHRINLLAEKAMWEAVAGVIEEHRQDGHPLAIWEDEKVVWISAEEAQQGFDQGSLARWGRVLKARKTVLPSTWGMG